MCIRRKAEGSVLIETIVSLMIISSIIGIIGKLSVEANKNMYIRIERERLSRIIYCIEEEIKYNYTYDNLLQRRNSTIYLDCNKNFLEELVSQELLTMPRGNEVIINIKEEIDGELKISVKIVKGIYNTFVQTEKEFTKSRWMDEVYR